MDPLLLTSIIMISLMIIDIIVKLWLGLRKPPTV
jgi:hypothetical protein